MLVVLVPEDEAKEAEQKQDLPLFVHFSRVIVLDDSDCPDLPAYRNVVWGP